jgi:hypothetical protein
MLQLSFLKGEGYQMRKANFKKVLFTLIFLLLISNISQFIISMPEANASDSDSTGWLYDGWQYRKMHNLTAAQETRVFSFYAVSSSWTTIAENPTHRHAFQPVHNTTMVEVNIVVDGAVRKYVAYDSDEYGSEIRLYYTNDTAEVWMPYSQNPILGPSGYNYRWPSTAYVTGTFHMFLTDRSEGTLERWTSTDGIHFTFSENIKTGGNQWKNPFIWCNPNDNKWYLYTHDTSYQTETFKARNAGHIEDLDLASDTIVVSRNLPFGAPAIMFYDSNYWLLGEISEGGVWKTVAYYSTTSSTSGFEECINSPILTDDCACTTLLLNQDQTKAYLFTSRDSSVWYQETREIYLNSAITSELPNIFDYQIRIKTFYGSGTDSGENAYLNGHSISDFADVRFTWFNSSSRSEVACSYWIEELTPADSAVFWVKVPEILKETDTTIYLYYGKNDVTTTSNGTATFDFFDDFSGNLAKWTIVGGTWQIENGELSSQTTSFPYGQRIRATNFSFNNHSVHVKVKWISGTYFEHGPFVRGQQPNEQNNGYMTFISTWGGDYRDRISELSGAVETTLASQGSTTPSQNVWYSFVFKLFGNTLKSSITPLYSTEIRASDTTFTNGTLSLFSWSAASEHVHYDDLFVRKYVDPEPSHAGWDSETPTYALSVSLVGGGSVSLNNSGPYHLGDVVELTAVPDAGWGFSGWSGGFSSVVNPVSVVINGSTSVTATFTQIEYALSVSLVGGGSVSLNNSGPYHLGDVVELTAVPDAGWGFSGWSGGFSSVVNPVSVVINGSTSVTATFTQITFTPFSMISNSTVSELAFNSTSKILRFTLTGPSGTYGFTNVTIAKTLMGDVSTLKVYLDENEISYVTTEADSYWLIHITYPHSTHRVTVILGSSQPAQTSDMTLDSPETTAPNNVPLSTSEPTEPNATLPDSSQPTPPSITSSDSYEPAQPNTISVGLITSVIAIIVAILSAIPVSRHINSYLRTKTKADHKQK